MPEKTLPPGLHVILGDSAGGTFRRVFHPSHDRLIIDQDVLCCGPTPASGGDDWKIARHDYWKKLVPGLVGHTDGLPANEMIDRAAEFSSAGRITIWAATSLSEQLFVAHAIHRATQAGAAEDELFIVQFEQVPGRTDRILGTGELSEKFMGDPPEPARVPGQDLRGYRELWSALTSADPLPMDRFAESNPLAGHWMRQASQLMRRRFPDRQSGLGFWDRALLREVQLHGPNAARVIGYTMVDHWSDGDIVGDWYLFGRLLQMGNPELPAPLVSMTDTDDMRNAQVQLTAFGRDVLEGRASNYPSNPIEEWTAGVRLSSREGRLWFDAGDRLVPA